MRRFQLVLFAYVLIILSACASSPSMEKGMEAFDSGEYGVAIRHLRPIAAKGNLDAQLALAVAYEQIFDHRSSVRWYTKAAEQDDAGACYRVGNAYALGLGAERDGAIAIDWWRRAGEKGSIEAQWALATAYSNGDLVKSDRAKAAEWYLRAAEAGDANAQYIVGTLYAFGNGVPQDPVQAYAWLSLSAEQLNWERTRTLRDQIKATLSEAQLSEAERALPPNHSLKGTP